MDRLGDSETRTRRALLHMLEELKRERDALREARRQWVETVDSVRDPLLVHDTEGRIVRANRAYAERAGMTFRELIGRPYWQCFPRRDGPLAKCAALHMARPSAAAGEEEITVEGGRLFLSRSFGIDEGPPSGRYGLHLFEDITERRRAEERLRLMAYLVESSPIVAFRWRPEAGWPVDYVSDNVCLWGYDVEELSRGARSYASLVHPDDLERVGREMDDYTRRGLERFGQEYRVLTATGRVRWVDGRTVVERDASGAVRYLQGLVIDITERRSAEAKLRESEAKFRGLVETTADWIWEVDGRGAYTYCSPQVKALLGYEPEEMLGRTPFDFMAAGDAVRVAASFAAAASARQAFAGMENANQRKDGSEVVLETSGVPILGAGGELLGYRGIDRDITVRKHAREALEQRERHFRKLIEGSGDAFYVIDRAGTVVYRSPSSSRLSGYADAEALGATITDHLVPDSVSRGRAAVAQVLKHPADAVSIELAMVRKDGRRIDIEAMVRNHLADPDVRGIVVTARDITARKAAEAAVRESEARFRALTELSSDFYWETDAEHRLVQRGSGGRPSTVSLFNEGRQIGKRRWEIPYLSPDEAGWQAHQADLEAHRPFRDFEISREGDAGAERFIALSGDPIFDNAGAFKGYRGVGKDVTERKLAERKLRERLDELQRWSTLNLDREDRVLELKREVNALAAELRRPAPYASTH